MLLTNTLPVQTNAVTADITQISYTNVSSRSVTTTSSAQSSGTYKLTLTDLTLSFSGAVATFRYVVICNSTATNGELIAWFDYGSAYTPATGESLLIDFDGTNGFFTDV